MELSRRMFNLGAIASAALTNPKAGPSPTPPGSLVLNEAMIEAPSQSVRSGPISEPLIAPGEVRTYITGFETGRWHWHLLWTRHDESDHPGGRLTLAMMAIQGTNPKPFHDYKTTLTYDGLDLEWVRASWSHRTRGWETSHVLFAGKQDVYELYVGAPEGHDRADALRKSLRVSAGRLLKRLYETRRELRQFQGPIADTMLTQYDRRIETLLARGSV